MSARSSARFCVIDCEDAPKWDGHENLWFDALGRPDEQWSVVRAWNGELPSSVTEFAGFVISGSHYSVNQSLPWLEGLFEFVRGCVGHRDGGRIFGACFGLQVVCKALGGVVAANPDQRFAFGAEQIQLTDQYFDCWFADPSVGPSMNLLVSHGEQAQSLPPGAESLAGSMTTEHEIIRIADRVLAGQFHAEFTADLVMKNVWPRLIDEQRLTEDEQIAAKATLVQPVDSHKFMAVVRRFLDGPPSPEH